MPKLSESMKLANSSFAETIFKALNEGGIWGGDDFEFKKLGDKFYAMDKKSWCYAQQTLSPVYLIVRFDLGNPIYKPAK